MTMDEKVTQTESGITIKAEIKRGNDTRDQDKIYGVVKRGSLEEAKSDMEELKTEMENWADDLRAIQPDE